MTHTGNHPPGAGRPTRDRRWGDDPRRRTGGEPDPTEDEVDPEFRAREICLRMLTRAPRSRAQLAQALHRARIPDDTAESVLGRFAEVGLIDDAEFAAAWVESRHQGKGLARAALAHELGERGVAEDVRLAAVDRIDADAELATARRLVARRLAATRHLSAVARARKLCAMLARKGYPEEIALRVVREALRDEGGDVAAVEDIIDI